jgi:hypothetical protein
MSPRAHTCAHVQHSVVRLRRQLSPRASSNPIQRPALRTYRNVRPRELRPPAWRRCVRSRRRPGAA